MELNATVQEEPAQLKMKVGVKKEHQDDEDGSRMPMKKALFLGRTVGLAVRNAAPTRSH
ncbi:hypothetical protein HO173_012166 [Letharia columbiana]|uniref:Uncharacterized protein n=1 Tax=Letharia columbiana TaxID=112416 RepID=A0A8H6FGC6_9LECA|nr:uncharacterized protein HO173_012166 [Letharia columbiana]KAF6227527.1 hypothetical protein HO173_012166 [Letharia columbiana]